MMPTHGAPMHGPLPTLTEVIEIEAEGAAAGTPAPPTLDSMPMEFDEGLAAQAALEDQRAALAVAVLDALDPQIDALLEARLNAALTPQLRRLVQDAIRQVRGEVAASLHALVAQAIDDALAQRKKP